MADYSYYDPSQAAQNQSVPQPYYPQISMPNQQQDYSYLTNQNYIIQNQQNTVSDTIRTAQWNMQQHMQNVLQGTMAAGMAIYNVGQSATSKMKEAQYQDVLLGNGNYVLQRGMWRETMWGFGIAQSDIGRALKIGGRRPEFLTGGEYQFQMERAARYGREEMIDMLIGGGATMGAQALGTAMGGPLGFVAGTAVGVALDQTVGKIVEPFIDARKARREMRQFTDMTNLNLGLGQRRMSDDAANELADRFHHHDVSAWKYVPIVGGALGKRLGPDTRYDETFKKMAQLDMFRDVKADDVNKIEERVKETVKIVEKLAGLAHTTKEAILQMKGGYTAMGFTDTLANQAVSNVVKTSLATGIDANTINSYNVAFQRGAFANGYNASVVGQVGVNEIASLRAGQELGTVSRMYDPGTLAMQNVSNAMAWGHTGLGKVVRFGSGSIGVTQDYYSRLGRGGGYGAAGGLMMEQLDFMFPNSDPLADFAKGVRFVSDKFGGGIRGLQAALSQARSKEEAMQIYNSWSGSDRIQEMVGGAMAAKAQADRTGDKSRLAVYNALEVNATPDIYAKADPNSKMAQSRKFFNETTFGMRNVQAFDKEKEAEAASRYETFRHNYGNQLAAYYEAVRSGNIKEANSIKYDLTKLAKERGYSGEIDKILSLSLVDGDKAVLARREWSGTDIASALLPLGSNLIYAHSKIKDQAAAKATATIEEQRASLYDSSSYILKDYKEKQGAGIKWMREKLTGLSSKDEEGLYYYANMMKREKDPGKRQALFDTFLGRITEVDKKGGTQLAEYFANNNYSADDALNIMQGAVKAYEDNRKSNQTVQEFNFWKEKFGGKAGADYSKWRQEAGWYGSSIRELKGMSPEKARETLKKWAEGQEGKNFQYNMTQAFGGDETLGRIRYQALVEAAKSGNQELWNREFGLQVKASEGIGALDEKTRKELGLGSNDPNLAAVESLTRACDALANAISGTGPHK